MLTILTAWAFIKSRRNWIIYGLGLFACFLTTRYFPWKLTAGTPFEMVQLTARYLSYASLFLTILFALGSSSVLEEHVTGRKKLALSCSLAVFMALFSLSSLSVYRDTLKHVQDMPKTSANSTQPAPFKRLRDYNYYNQFNYKILFGAYAKKLTDQRAKAKFSFNAPSLLEWQDFNPESFNQSQSNFLPGQE